MVAALKKTGFNSITFYGTEKFMQTGTATET
jgi:hypothetical protein